MKYLLSSLLIISFAVTVFITAATKVDEASIGKYMENDSASVRVMTFNIRYDNPDDGLDAWPNRKEMVARTMRFHKADFVGIQEGMLHQLEQLDKMLPYFDRIGVGRNAGEDPGEFSAIYYKKDRFNLIEGETFWLSDTPGEVGSTGWDAALPRIVTWGKFRDTRSGETFYVFNTHFDHIGETARAESAALILDKIEEIAGDTPVVVTGDFNTTENDPPYKILTGTQDDPDNPLEDGFYEAEYGHHGPTSTWNGFEEIVPNRRIDFIFTNPGFDVIQHAAIADQQEGRFPSDHLPVVADIEFAD